MTEPSFTLKTGAKIPAVGFGTYSEENLKGKTYESTLHALKVGYRHLDCAWYYQNESEVGQALREFYKAEPSVKRADLFITTKVWNHLHKPEDVKWSLNDSLKKMGLDYVDLFLVHWPIAVEKNDENMPKKGADGKVCHLPSEEHDSSSTRLIHLTVHFGQIPDRAPRNYMARYGGDL
jgi:diketogulonate reductase-like aldo/keto reductase